MASDDNTAGRGEDTHIKSLKIQIILRYPEDEQFFNELRSCFLFQFSFCTGIFTEIILEMRLTLFLGGILIFNQVSFAQKERFVHDTRNFIQSGFYNLVAFPDDEGNLIVMYKQKTLDVPAKFFTYLIFNTAGTTKEIKLSGDMHFQGVAYKSGLYTIVLKDDNATRTRREAFLLLQVKKTGEIIKNTQIDLGKEEVISKFSYRGDFYILSLAKEDDLIHLRTISNSSEIKIFSIGIEKAILKELTDVSAQLTHNDFELSNREVFGSKIVPVGEKKFRVFTRADIVNKKGDYINSLILDFNSHGYSVSSLPVEHKTFSYFVAGDSLILVNTTSTQINLHMYSLENSSKITSQSFNKGDTESVIFKGPFFKDSEVMEFKDDKQKIKAIFSGFSDGVDFVNFLRLNGMKRITIGARVIPPSQPYISVGPTGGVITRSANVTYYDEEEVSYYHLYVFFDDKLNLLQNYPNVRSSYDIAGAFVTSTRLENKRLISDFRIIATASKTYLITNSNKSKLIKCFEWDNSAKEK